MGLLLINKERDRGDLLERGQSLYAFALKNKRFLRNVFFSNLGLLSKEDRMGYGVEIHVEKIEGKVVLRIEGRLDAVTCAVVEKKIQALIEEKHIHLLLDFNEVEYMSSAGLRFLLSYTKRLKSLEGSFILFSLSDEVLKIVRMAGFEKVLRICKDEKEALGLKLSG